MKSILITGAYGGMGKETAELLANKGFKVFALDRNIGEEKENIISVKADLCNKDDIENAFEEIKKHTDELYAIIHFAGVYMLDSLVELSSESFEKAFEINVFAAAKINKTFLPLLKKGSRIIITTSELASLDPLPFTGLYAVTKSALDKYAYSLKMELQLLDIKVSVLRAGAVKTDMLGVSTNALDNFVKNTKLYSCNAKRFKAIVEGVEARSVPAEKIAIKISKILGAKKPRFAYKINRNPLLLLLNAMPKGFQFWIIKKILK